MRVEPAHEPLGWADLLALPEDMRAEIIGGHLVRPPAALPRHSRAQRAAARFVDPSARTLEALRLDPGQKAWVEVGAYDDASVARIEPFEAIELEVGRIFPPGE